MRRQTWLSLGIWVIYSCRPIQLKIFQQMYVQIFLQDTRISQTPLLKNNASFVKRDVALVPRRSVCHFWWARQEAENCIFWMLGWSMNSEETIKDHEETITMSLFEYSVCGLILQACLFLLPYTVAGKCV